jgi:hypothetical protein
VIGQFLDDAGFGTDLLAESAGAFYGVPPVFQGFELFNE